MSIVNVYELVKRVLDESYDELGGAEPARDARVKQALSKLSKDYKTLHAKPGPAYDDAATRFAYIFRYVTCHANLVSELLARPETRELFTRPQVVASCIGGGPGSDVVGIIKRLLKMYDENEPTPRVQVYLCDREKRWLDSWGDVGLHLPNININAVACEIDVTNAASWSMTKYLKADLFTMSFFLSEVFTRKDEATPFFEHVFRSAQPGALFAFVDNNADTFSEWFDGMVRAAGLEVLHKQALQRKMPRHEQQSVLDRYLKKFGDTRLTANVAERLVRKPLK